MSLRPVGIYREMFHGRREDLPSIFDARNGRQIDDRERVLAYMRAATPGLDIMESVRDIVNGQDYLPGGPSLTTDGEWIWRDDSIHYIRKYGLDLSDEFLAHVRAQDYTPPPDVDIRDESIRAAIREFV